MEMDFEVKHLSERTFLGQNMLFERGDNDLYTNHL